MTYFLRVRGPKSDCSNDVEDDLTDKQKDCPKSIEEATKDILKEEGIVDDIWNNSSNGKQFAVEFDVIGADNLERIMNKMAAYDIGKTANSSIMMLEATAYVAKKPTQSDMGEVSETAFKKFVNSLKSRMTVAQVYHSINQRGSFTIDYLCFLLCAALIADIALVTNRPAIIFASMLLSPMMDPILCILFGFILEERKMTIKGSKNAGISIFLCILVGLLCGYFMHRIAILEAVAKYPTEEIISRGNYIYIVSIILITVFSGVSVAFAILNNVISALIGNAISLSLLPPAVNCGHLLFLSVLALVEKNSVMSGTPNSHNATCNYTWVKEHTLVYVRSMCEAPKEFAIMAAFSLFVSVLNILVVLGTGYLVCKAKDMAPKSFANPETRKFYTEDVKEYRDVYKTLQHHDLDARELAGHTYREYMRINNVGPGQEEEMGVEETQRLNSDFRAVFKGVKRDRHLQTITARAGANERFLHEFERGINQRTISSHLRPATVCQHGDWSSPESIGDDQATLNHLTVGGMRGRPLRNLPIQHVTLGAYGNQVRQRHLLQMVERQLCDEDSGGSRSESELEDQPTPSKRRYLNRRSQQFYKSKYPESAVSVSTVGKFEVVTTLTPPTPPMNSVVMGNSGSSASISKAAASSPSGAGPSKFE